MARLPDRLERQIRRALNQSHDYKCWELKLDNRLQRFPEHGPCVFVLMPPPTHRALGFASEYKIYNFKDKFYIRVPSYFDTERHVKAPMFKERQDH
jgi:hypothetical protein